MSIFENVSKKALFITTGPRGVGRNDDCLLLKNTLLGRESA